LGHGVPLSGLGVIGHWPLVTCWFPFTAAVGRGFESAVR
jgi:hypothetical protein